MSHGATGVFVGCLAGSRATHLAGRRRWCKGGGLQQVGGFKALADGAVGERDTVKASALVSAPFTSWFELGTVTSTYGVVPFTDAQALTNANRFYRLQRVEP